MIGEIATINFKWAVIMTHLIFTSPSVEVLGPPLIEALTEPTESCAVLLLEDHDGWIAECINTATPEPIVYEIVTELLSITYDSRKQCQDSVDDAMVRWSGLPATERLIGLTLKCFWIDLGE
ncbi:hypothetical protein LCGC14_0373660 [marine sediment metagenome]|uniref:Uncharacterized protein n=1 Tax=marine sediment metagenome TaxID=412755 RepID=A0A0F9VRQ8_9ZZZZ